jgi:hypothetical protein
MDIEYFSYIYIFFKGINEKWDIENTQICIKTELEGVQKIFYYNDTFFRR